MEAENKILNQGDYNNWADIVIQIWKQKLIKYKIGAYRTKRKVTTESLFNSFTRFVYAQAGGDVKRIEFFFLQHGINVDTGTAKGSPWGGSSRKAKNWYSKAWYAEVQKLQQHLLEQMGNTAYRTLLMEMPEIIDGKK